MYSRIQSMVQNNVQIMSSIASNSLDPNAIGEEQFISLGQFYNEIVLPNVQDDGSVSLSGYNVLQASNLSESLVTWDIEFSMSLPNLI